MTEAKKGVKAMRSARSMLGLPVVCGGEAVGRLAQVRLDDSLTRVEGVYLYCGLAGTRYIECADLDLLGEVAVLSRSRGRRTGSPPAQPPRRAVGPDGARLGAVTDALIDEQALTVCSLELSRGYLEDLTRGRTRVCRYSVCPGGEVLIDQTEGGSES